MYVCCNVDVATIIDIPVCIHSRGERVVFGARGNHVVATAQIVFHASMVWKVRGLDVTTITSANESRDILLSCSCGGNLGKEAS